MLLNPSPSIVAAEALRSERSAVTARALKVFVVGAEEGFWRMKMLISSRAS
jgi:hypothetical protein